MPIFSNVQRMKIALGGLATLVGILVLACVGLTLTGSANLALVFQGWSVVPLTCAVGALDLICGLSVILGKRKVILSSLLSSHQEKAHADAG